MKIIMFKKNYVKIKKTKLKQPKKKEKETSAEIKSQTINVLGHRDVFCATAPNVTEVCIFNIFAHEILPVDDAVWRWQSFIYEEFKDIFEENKQGSDGKSCAWTHFVAFEMADKAKPSRSLLLTASYCIFMRRITFLFLF